GEPSGVWPANSNHEHLQWAGLWVGGIVGADTMVTAAPYAFGEWFNHEMEGCGDPPEGICETAEGAPNGLRRFDDDGDGTRDEDRLDGKDNDGDALFDEDFAAISNEMFATEYYDTSTYFNQFYPDPANHHHPLGLHVIQETYAWSNERVDDFVGVELRITNISHELDGVGWTIEKPYVGMMVDADVGFDNEDLTYWLDDQAAYVEGQDATTRLRMAYMFDQNGGENSADDIPSFLGVVVLDREVHAFRAWSGGDQDPRDDIDRYLFLRGTGDDVQTIDPPTTRPLDYRFLISTGPFDDLAPGERLDVRFAFVAGLMEDGRPDLANPLQGQRVYDGLSTDAGQVHWTASLPPGIARAGAPAPQQIRVEPNPVRVSGGAFAGPVRFRNLPEGAAVRIYSIEGRLVAALAAGRDAAASWSPSTAGVYLYRVSASDGSNSDGKLVVLR
ncbi:MAG: T9SS type A sorting domain-containing protein, partial [bacterium]